MDVVVRGRALGHLDGGDAQGPDVGLAVVAIFLVGYCDDLTLISVLWRVRLGRC